MDSIENFQERFDALEYHTAGLARQLRSGRSIAYDRNRRRPRRAHWGASLLVVTLVVYASVSARSGQAADFTCGAGDVACLINAINMANANGQANTITLKAGTYTLTAVDNFTDGNNGLPSVTSVLTIRGARAANTIIERDNTSIPSFRILNVAPTGTLILQRLTLRNGGSIFSVFPGGGIFNSGTLTLIDCILAKNNAERGGGLFNNTGTVTITRTTFDGNEGGHGAGGLSNGFFSEGGTVTIANSTFAHNISSDGAGGLDNFNMGIMTLTNTTVAQNVGIEIGVGGIGNNNGVVLLQSSTVAENHGGAPAFGAHGGISNGNNGIVLLQNTIIARNDFQNFPVFEPSDCSGPITSLGNNLIGDLTTCTITLQPSDLTGDPGLGTFTNNGTPGNGHFPLLSSSQAIDAGNNAVCFRTDQLGRRRIGPCDIGAISFRGKDDGRHEEKDEHQHEENIVKAFR